MRRLVVDDGVVAGWRRCASPGAGARRRSTRGRSPSARAAATRPTRRRRRSRGRPVARAPSGSPSSPTARRRARSGRSCATASRLAGARWTSSSPTGARRLQPRPHGDAHRPGGRGQARRPGRLAARAGAGARRSSARSRPGSRPSPSTRAATMYKKLGVLAHVGQPEGDAGFKAGQRLARAGVRRALCVNLAIPNQGLDARCARARRARCARPAAGRAWCASTTSRRRRRATIARAVRGAKADGVLAMNSLSGLAAVKGLAGAGIVDRDVRPGARRAARRCRRRGSRSRSTSRPYLQGYLPVVFLAERARYGLFPAQGDVIPTGPNFVTQANAAKAIELSARSIR